jgi:uncharacterized protein (DUF362 family)
LNKKGIRNMLARNCSGLTRREFVKLMAIVSAATAIPAPFVRTVETLVKSGPVTNVSISGVPTGTCVSDLIIAVRQAAEASTDFSWLSRGDSVLIKPAVNSGNPYPATTHPAGIKAMIMLLKEKGAKRIIVSDLAGIEHVKLSPEKLRGSTRELMTSCGVTRAVVEAGAELYFPEEEGWHAFFEDGPVSGSHWKAGIMMPKILKEVDHIVLMPRCSRHPLAGASIGMKAAVGYWRTDSRLEYHHDAATFHEKTAEANTVSSLKEKQRMTLTVADKIITTSGPDKGYAVSPRNGLVFASKSLVAHDMVSLAWFLESRRTVPEDQKTGRNDPYSSQFLVNIANRWVVNLLGGVLQSVSAETLIRKDLESIWDDRVLMHAFKLYGGIPQLKFIEANSKIPAEVKRGLSAMTTLTEKT